MAGLNTQLSGENSTMKGDTASKLPGDGKPGLKKLCCSGRYHHRIRRIAETGSWVVGLRTFWAKPASRSVIAFCAATLGNANDSFLYLRVKKDFSIFLSAG